MIIRSVWLKSFLLWGIFTILCGGVYPLVVTLLAQGLFPKQAGGSLETLNGRLVGSKLLAQPFHAPGYFNGRPSACGYSTLPSRASNLASTGAALRDSILERRVRFLKENGLRPDAVVPMEMLTASGSGLDPHISVAAARLQIERIAEQRHMDTAQKLKLNHLVTRMIEPRQWGILGEPRINVVKLNWELNTDSAFCTLK